MNMDPEKIKTYGDTLYKSLREQSVIDPITDAEPGISIEDA